MAAPAPPFSRAEALQLRGASGDPGWRPGALPRGKARVLTGLGGARKNERGGGALTGQDAINRVRAARKRSRSSAGIGLAKA
jgi:hypothetical protein